MSANDYFLSALGLLLYSGPLLPAGATFLFKHTCPERFRRNLRLFLILLGVQVLSFLPYVFEVCTSVPDALHALILPALLGLLLFVGTAIHLGFEFRQYLRAKQSKGNQ